MLNSGYHVGTCYHHGADVVVVLVPLDGGDLVNDADVDVGRGGRLLALFGAVVI
jgi:hypothetical protein